VYPVLDSCADVGMNQLVGPVHSVAVIIASVLPQVLETSEDAGATIQATDPPDRQIKYPPFILPPSDADCTLSDSCQHVGPTKIPIFLYAFNIYLDRTKSKVQ